MAEWPGVGGSGGFDYVQSSLPAEPVEGEEWYITATDASHSFGADEARVYDGATWHLMSVTDHAELGGVGPDQHHTKSTLSNGGTSTVTASRSFATQYTNNTGNLLMVVAKGALGASSGTTSLVDGSAADYTINVDSTARNMAFRVLVPPGATYTISSNGAASSMKWWDETEVVVS